MANATVLYRGIIKAAARRFGIPEGLLERQIMAESGGNPAARSPVGALGLMQLMPATARGLGVENPLDPHQNIMGGAKYLRDQFNKFGNWREALAAYNAGPGAVAKYGGVPPFAETRHYVSSILGGLPNVGAAPQAPPPAATASAGMGASAPTLPAQPNFMQMAQQFADQSQIPQDLQAQPLDEIAQLNPDPFAFEQFLPHAAPSQHSPLLRTFAPRFSADVGALPGGGHNGIVQAAKGYLGVPYKWGGTSRQSGLDCSGFIQNVFRDAGIKLPRTTYEQVNVGQHVSLKNLAPGDVVFTEPGHAGPNHVGLYVGHGMIQESPHTGTVNSYIPLKNYLGGGFVAARRYTSMLPPKGGKSGKR